MQKDYRLINDFKKQTLNSIWKHLDAMAVNYAVYSSYLKGLSPYLTDFDLYVYCDNTSLVVVCLDCCGHGEEQTYEESDTLSSLIFTEGKMPRESMVWKLAQTVGAISRQLSIPAYGLLLTEAEILNSFELHDLWNDNNIGVIDSAKRLKHKIIAVNRDRELAGKHYVDALMTGTLSDSETDEAASSKTNTQEDGRGDGWETIIDDDEFEQLIKDFMNHHSGLDLERVPADSATDGDDREDDEDVDNDPEDDMPDDFKDDAASIFPNGEIAQNATIGVKVDILKPINNPREELDKLVGCADIKRRMDELVALTSYNKMMRELFPNSRQHEVSLHSLFLGRPGTGKSTVCKIYGSLLHQAGALSKGHVVVCNRGTFIGTLWGDEERSMRQVLEMAQGGVLMIDEAYLLNSGNANDPGKIVVQLLMDILADEKQRDLAVVLCGYKTPMQNLLDLNPGLQSRFPNKFEFADFTPDELLAITKMRIKDYDYRFTAKAWEKYGKMLAQAYQQRDPETWGNARFVGNQMERIYIQHATRCVRQNVRDKSALRMITVDDIVPIEVPRQKTKIGF